MAKSNDKADVWMPLYIGDYLADTTRLTTEQHGAYLLLIMDYWRNGPPPDEKFILQTITRLSDYLWKKHGSVLRNFFEVRDGHWHHKRIDAEMAEALSGKADASEKARKAAEARWGKKDAPSNAQGHAQAYAPAMLEECPSSSPSPISTNTSIGQSIVVGTKARPNDDSIPKNEGDWLRHMTAKHGFLADATSVHDRKRYWPTFAAWVNAGISTAQVDAAIAKAHAESTEPISNIVAYAARVLDSMTAKPAKPPRDDWNRSPKSIERKASELGIYARPGESHDALRERCESEIRRRAQGAAA